MTKTVAGELSATRVMVHDLASAHRTLAERHADTSVQLAAAIEKNTETSEQLSARLSDDVGSRIDQAVAKAVAPVGSSVADQIRRLEQAFAQFSHDKPAADHAIEMGANSSRDAGREAEQEFSDKLDRLNHNVGASMSAYSELLKQATSALGEPQQDIGHLFDRSRVAPDSAEAVASH
jgi:ABC-type transporter Mla subunit MlaD